MALAEPKVLVRSLREQVYDWLRRRLDDGRLAPGSSLDLDAIALELGVSRTPLRDALIQLECEGFVEILPRRGVRVARVTLDDVRDLYQLVGALEAAALREVGSRLSDREIERMAELDRGMARALDERDFARFYELNLGLHDVFLDRCENEELVRTVRTLKHRLYDFPRRRDWVEEWERRSIDEHERIIALLRAGEIEAAADFLRDVHWSFEVQEPFIRRYHADAEEE